MRKQPDRETTFRLTGRLTVLCVSPLDEDHVSLQAIVGHQTKWKLFSARDLNSAVSLMGQYEIAVLLCERELVPGTWKDMLELVRTFPNPHP